MERLDSESKLRFWGRWCSSLLLVGEDRIEVDSLEVDRIVAALVVGNWLVVRRHMCFVRLRELLHAPSSSSWI